jgi:putative transposase
VKYAFVEKNRRQYGVPALRETLQVSRSGYYTARQRGPSDRQKRRFELTARIRTIHQASRESYGAISYEAPLPFEAMKSPSKVSTVRG